MPEAVATEETEIGTPPLVTMNALANALVVERFSLYVRVIVVPAAVFATDAYTGTVLSTSEPFVTLVVDNDAASKPKTSCVAAFELALSATGALYATVTTWP